MHESVERFIDDPVKVMAPITIGTAALYAFFAESIPDYREMTIALGTANFMLNTACWIKFARDRNRETISGEALQNDESFVDEAS